MRQLAPIRWVAQACLLCLLCLTLLSPLTVARSFALPLGVSFDTRGNELTTRADDEKFLLRIMPLGASITLGYKSTDGNGYREWIRQQLRSEGWPVQMVGSRRFGKMRDNRNEGHIGFRIDQLSKKAEETIPEKPNLILINAGTNDALQDYQIYSAGLRMGKLVDKLLSSIDGTTIILSTLLPNKKKPEKVEIINEQFRDLVAYHRAKNDRIVLADMSKFITADELVDGIHPDDAGYERMASVWWAAFQTAQSEGMLQNFNYTVSALKEKKLDDNTTDPNLPAYSAPAQPTVTGGQPPFGRVQIWVLVSQIFSVYIGFSTMYM
ncbi:hypothetical protein N7532_006980 [Penicillium argentinense]|uniref:SGNH hydrolase-type esterase domain-containing protein n=1 Tax=Penicillium argentinense TaxID=1131581 RepID=A0A9W9FGZ9_9EURO|nr:uncharacterized protein N7532_006980 [Penicillium argentinense]KAJ5099979.1 hypothetical protein N7532_006980 [Penicillium argentinense]